MVSQLARQIFGGGLLYYEIQVVTMLILILAANTSFADFPRLAFFLARDGFIPRQFGTRGDRLVFSNGILILGGMAALLIVIFRRRHPRPHPALRGGRLHLLHPLAGQHGAALARAPGRGLVVALVAQRGGRDDHGPRHAGDRRAPSSPTAPGSWCSSSRSSWPLFITVHRHYADVAGQLSMEGYDPPRPSRTRCWSWSATSTRAWSVALRYGQAISPSVKGGLRRDSIPRRRGGWRRSGASGGWASPWWC